MLKDINFETEEYFNFIEGNENLQSDKQKRMEY